MKAVLPKAEMFATAYSRLGNTGPGCQFTRSAAMGPEVRSLYNIYLHLHKHLTFFNNEVYISLYYRTGQILLLSGIRYSSHPYTRAAQPH